MDTTAQRQNAVSQLLGVSTSKGYVTFDDILEVIDKGYTKWEYRTCNCNK